MKIIGVGQKTGVTVNFDPWQLRLLTNPKPTWYGELGEVSTDGRETLKAKGCPLALESLDKTGGVANADEVSREP